MSGGPQDGGEGCGSGTFAIRSSDQDAGEAPLGMPQCFREHPHVLEVEFAIAAELVSEREQPLDRTLVRSCGSCDLVKVEHEELLHHEVDGARDEVLHLLAR